MAEEDESLFKDEHCDTFSGLDDRVLWQTSGQLGHEWRKFGSFIGISRSKMERLQQDHPRTEDQIFQMLVSVRDKNPSGAYSTILKALDECGRNDVALDLKNRMKGVYDQPSTCTSSSQAEGRSENTETSGIEMDEESVNEEHVQCCHKCMLQPSTNRVGRKKRKRKTKTNWKQREEKKKLKFMPHAAYNSLMVTLRREFASDCDLQDLKDLTVQDHKKYNMEVDQLAIVDNIRDFFSCLEERNLLGEDNLYFVQFLAYELKKDAAVIAIDDYIEKSEGLPLIMHRVERKSAKGSKLVEYHIEGDCGHANMKDPELFRKTLSERFRIPLRHINLVALGNGSIILVFQMPEIGAKRVHDALARRDPWFQENNVLDVHIEGEDCVMIQENTSEDVQNEISTDATSAKVTEIEVTDKDSIINTCTAKGDHLKNSSDDTKNKEAEVEIKVTDKDPERSGTKKVSVTDDLNEKSSKCTTTLQNVCAFISKCARKVKEVPKKVTRLSSEMESRISCTKGNDLSSQVTHYKVEVPERNPRVLMLYSEDHEWHGNCISKLAIFLQIICSCQVRLDIWNTTKNGNKKAWLCSEITNADKVLMIFSKGTLCKWTASMEQKPTDKQMLHELDDMFLTGYRYASEEFQRDPCLLSSKYVAAYFDYSEKEDVLPDIRHVARYNIPINLEQLYFRLHDMVQHSPRSSRRIPTLQLHSFTETSSEGLALHHAIEDMKNLINTNPDWYDPTYIPIDSDDQPYYHGKSEEESPDPSFFQQPCNEEDDDNESVAYSDCFAEIGTVLDKDFENYELRHDSGFSDSMSNIRVHTA